MIPTSASNKYNTNIYEKNILNELFKRINQDKFTNPILLQCVFNIKTKKNPFLDPTDPIYFHASTTKMYNYDQVLTALVKVIESISMSSSSKDTEKIYKILLQFIKGKEQEVPIAIKNKIILKAYRQGKNDVIETLVPGFNLMTYVDENQQPILLRMLDMMKYQETPTSNQDKDLNTNTLKLHCQLLQKYNESKTTQTTIQTMLNGDTDYLDKFLGNIVENEKDIQYTSEAIEKLLETFHELF